MKLSSRSRYGLRLMFELAVRDGNAPVLLKDIARRQNISEKYLSKLVIPLRGAKLLSSARGMNGGYMLARAPASISVKEIVETLEGDVTSKECTEHESSFPESTQDATRSFWCRLDEAIDKVLTENTLGTLVEEYLEKNRTGAVNFDI